MNVRNVDPDQRLGGGSLRLDDIFCGKLPAAWRVREGGRFRADIVVTRICWVRKEEYPCNPLEIREGRGFG